MDIQGDSIARSSSIISITLEIHIVIKQMAMYKGSLTTLCKLFCNLQRVPVLTLKSSNSLGAKGWDCF